MHSGEYSHIQCIPEKKFVTDDANTNSITLKIHSSKWFSDEIPFE